MHSRRIDLEREISIQVPAFDAFITEYSKNISATGMFIRSDKPLPPETLLTFEFRIAEDWRLIHGKAKVMWSRFRNEGPDQPTGMGVLFTELEPQSRRLINWIIEKHIRDGGTPFDLGDLAEPTDLDQWEGADEADGDAAAARAAARPVQPATRPPRPKPGVVERAEVKAAPKPVRSQNGPLILAGLAVALVLAGLFWLSERSAQSIAEADLEAGEARAPSGPADAEVEPAASDAAEAGDAPPAAGSPPAPSASAAPAPAVSPVFAAAVEQLVDGWSRAWSEQDVDAYLSYYSRSFRPADGRSRSAWAAGRRERLEAPGFIEISVNDLEVEAQSESRGRVVFDQGYRSDTYQDSVRKVLELVREDGRWKILGEKTAG